MGGLGKNAGQLQYVKLKEGKFYLSTDKDAENPYDELTGLVTDFRFKDEEYKGVKNRKLYVNVKDDDVTYSFSVSIDSSYASSLINFLKTADLTEKLTFIPSMKNDKNDKGEDVKKYSIFVKQDDTALKGYYSKATGNSLPEFKKLKVSGKVVWDKTDFLEELERIVVEEFIPSVQKNKSPLIKEVSTPVDPDDLADGEDDGADVPWSK